MDKHTKHLLFFYGAMFLASVSAFCIMFVLPMIESGRSPPRQQSAQWRITIFRQLDEVCKKCRFRLKSLDFCTLKC